MYEDFFVKRVVMLRLQKGISARDMSSSIGQNRNFINQIENGKALPSMQSFFYICEYLSISPKDFFDDGTENPLLINNLIHHLNNLSEKQINNIAELVKDIK